MELNDNQQVVDNIITKYLVSTFDKHFEIKFDSLLRTKLHNISKETFLDFPIAYYENETINALSFSNGIYNSFERENNTTSHYGGTLYNLFEYAKVCPTQNEGDDPNFVYEYYKLINQNTYQYATCSANINPPTSNFVWHDVSESDLGKLGMEGFSSCENGCITPSYATITFTPVSCEMCDTETEIPTLYYITEPVLTNEFTVLNDALTIDYNNDLHSPGDETELHKYAIQFVNKNNIVIMKNGEEFVCTKVFNTGNLSIKACQPNPTPITINPRCPDICIPNNYTGNSDDVKDLTSEGINYNINSGQLSINSILQTRDTIKGIEYNITPIQNQ